MAGAAVPAPDPTDQELVVHAFAPCDGPRADEAYRQLGRIWQRCREELGTTEPIAGTGLPANLPASRPATGTGPLAAQENRAADHQMIIRREYGVVVLSMVFAKPLGTSRRRLKIGSALPSGWYEFDRWWHRLAAGETGALLGLSLVAQATVPPDALADAAAPAALAEAVRAAVRPADSDAPFWWRFGRRTGDGYAVWETTPVDDRAERRLVVLGATDRERELNAWTWTDGSVRLPPLGRYLLHAAKVRYEARIRGEGTQLTWLRDRADDRMNRVQAGLASSGAGQDLEAEIRKLLADEAELMLAVTRLREMRHTVEIAVQEMSESGTAPVEGDRALAESLGVLLSDDAVRLDATLARARHLRELVAYPPALAPPHTAAVPSGAAALLGPPEQAKAGPSRVTEAVEYRLQFGVDAVGYSPRTTPGQKLVQQRMEELVRSMVTAVGVTVEDTDRQPGGDGLKLVLPAKVEAHQALPRLLHAADDHLADDNEIYRDRLQVRLAVGVGPISSAALGFAGRTIIEVGRLLDSPALKDAAIDHPDADLVVLVSDRLYGDVVREGYPGLHPDEFVQVQVHFKEYTGPAWLWVGRTRPAGS